MSERLELEYAYDEGCARDEKQNAEDSGWCLNDAYSTPNSRAKCEILIYQQLNNTSICNHTYYLPSFSSRSKRWRCLAVV